ncbi:MAG: TGS domain-containing protein, partial [Patescibacteria group bacterium]
VFVFTPKGDVKVLPKGATPVDFAFAVHTQIGRECAGAKANGKAVSLNYPLRTGEVVEIMIAKGKKPSVDWLRFVKTEHARSEIEKATRSRVS